MKLLRSLRSGKISGKVCFLRIDLNVAFEDKKDMYRLDAVLPTIKFLLSRGVKIILVSHRGRPSSLRGVSNFVRQPADRISKASLKFSLKPFAKIISNKIKRNVKFLPNFDFNKIRWEILTSSGQIFLLENIRFCEGEGKNNTKFAKELASIADFYVNDAFSVSHRNDSSLSAITKFLPSYAGLSLEREINFLSKAFKKIKHPFTVIVGGVKTKDKVDIINTFWRKADNFLLGGGIANTFLAAGRFPIKKSVYDKNMIPRIKKFLNSKKIQFPTDFIVSNDKILDVGEMTTDKFSNILLKSRTIIWSGPLGFYHLKTFSYGTEAMWRAIMKNKKAFVLVGGGETVASLRLISKTPASLIRSRKNIFLSTGGGAMVEFLCGKKLPGIEALEKSRKTL